MAWVRRFTGPLIVGIAAWCAAGQLTVASAASASSRLVIAASLWVIVVAIGAAALVPSWRRDPRLALPASLSILPWLPVPLPAIALIWTGPLAWVPIALAVATAVGVAPIARLAAVPLAFAREPRRATWIAAALTVIAGTLVAWSIDPRTASGDEPHYFAIAESLLHDRDVRVDNNYRAPAFVAQFGSLKPDYRAAGKGGAIISVHAPGVPAIIAPAYAAFGYRGGQAVMLLLAALTGALIWRAGWRATDNVGAAWFAWAGVAGSATFLIQSVTVYPDGPGAVAVAASVLALVELHRDPRRVTTRALVGLSVALALLPWLHTRFVTLAVGFGALVAWQLWRDSTQSLEQRRTRLTALLAVPAVSALAWFGFFWVLYGTPSPTAPYAGSTDTSLMNVPGAIVALLFDGQWGLFVYTPVLLAACAALAYRPAPNEPPIVRVSFAVAFIYASVVGVVWMWWAGRPAPPARFLTAVLPIFGLGLATVWAHESPSARRGLGALLTLSLSICALILVVDRGGLAWNDRTAQANWLEWLNPVVNLPRGWPSFFWALDTARLSTEIPFVLHAVAFAGVATLVWLFVMSRLALRERSAARQRVAIAWALAIAVMAAVQVGWVMTGSGLDPARSQLAVMSAGAPRGSTLEIDAWRVRPISERGRMMTLQTEQLPVRSFFDKTPPLLSLSSVPAGTYELRFYADRPRGTTAVVRIDRGAVPFRTLPILPLAEQSAVLALPAGAATLTVTTDAPSPGLRVNVVPVQLETGQGALARSAARYDGLDVFFVDDHAFPPEADGFWVRGGQTAEIVVVARGGRDVLHLELGNGPNANQVIVSVGGLDRTLALRASEGKSIDLPFPGVDAMLRIRIASPMGFRPSEQSGNPDTRYLGVRVSVR